MTNKRTRKPSRQHVVWLTPDPVSGVQPALEEVGTPWLLTPHWALVDGRAVMVGLDIRSFEEPWVADPDHEAGGYPGPRKPVNRAVGLAEVTQAVIRGVSVSKVRQESQAYVAESFRSHADSIRDLDRVAGRPQSPLSLRVDEVAAAVTVDGRPRRRRPPATDALLARVAEVYLAATARGSKTPVAEVEEQLRAEGVQVSTTGGRAQVRKWVQRARVAGLLPPAH